jgi:hypothetical protein
LFDHERRELQQVGDRDLALSSGSGLSGEASSPEL